METEEWSLAVSAVALLVAGLTTWWTVKYARAQLDLARRIQREASEPYVVVDIEPSEAGSFVTVLSVRNIGPTMARNVRISATPELTSAEGDDVTEDLQRVLARTIPMIPPGRRLTYFFDTNRRFQSGLPMSFEFTVHAQGPSGDVEPLHYNVDLGVYAEALIGQRPTKFLEERLKGLEKSLAKLAKNYGVANQQAIRDEEQRRLEAYRRPQAQEEAGQDGTEAGSL